ncbi:MAG: hypothetical protein MK132_05240 [Lentisphaerales bacterium]|nr:hypothetical protein [Lentisphaerales bacterium]
MKCPECQTDVREDPISRDPTTECNVDCSCGYSFIFHPKIDGISDNLFINFLKGISFSNTRYFTFEQLVTLYPRHLKNGFWLTDLGSICAMFGLFFSFVLLSFLLAGFSILVFIISGIYHKNRKFAKEEIKAHLKKWQKYNGPLEYLLENVSIDLNQINQNTPKDAYDYGVNSILITQKDRLVDLLVLNEFHLEKQCLIISENAYPSHLYEQAKVFLNEQPDLKVFLLHNASDEGESMKERLLEKRELPLKEENIKDIGLFRSELKNLKFCRQNNIHKQESFSIEALPFSIMASGYLIFQFDEITALTDSAYEKATGILGYEVDSDGGSDFG